MSHAEYEKFVERLRLENPDILIYNTAHIFCPDGRCKVMIDSRLLYVDNSHLSPYGSQYLVNDLIEKLESLKKYAH